MRKNSAPKQSVASSKRRSTSSGKSSKYAKVNLSIPHGLLEQVDETAKREYTTRSDIIRQALLQYIWPAGIHGIYATRGKQASAMDLDDLLASLKKRQLQAHLKKSLKK